MVVIKNKVTIIVPVYADWPSLKECINSLGANVGRTNKILLVNDNGPEADDLEKYILQEIINKSNFEYYRNKKNLGFVKNCNNAVLKLDKTNNDVMLLNSDTKVTKGFMEAMQKALYSSPKVAVVSPRSNNATITTIPLWSAGQKGINRKKSYKLFNKIKNKLPETVEVPTAHGFCMLIKRSVIKKFGLFDEIFGLGYGEEVDFCQRMRGHGYKCLISNRTYVFHLEARSFTHEKKQKLLEVNNEIIWERYPKYRQEVREYMSRAITEEETTYPMFYRFNRRKIAKYVKSKLIS
jgi:GT2 family glycosyltransferase